MSTNLRLGNLLGILFVGCGLVACTTQAANPTGTGGSGAGTSGSGTGGTSSGGGTTGTGAGGGYASSVGVACAPPVASGVITDFTYMPGDAAAPDKTQAAWGTYGTTLSGGESAYANPPATLTSDVTGNDWHLVGNIANYSGFNIYFDTQNSTCNKFSAAAFKGIQFTIWGTTAGNMITLGMQTLDDAVVYGWLDSKDAGSPAKPTPGTCTPGPTATGQYYHPGCADPTFAFAVSGTQITPQTVMVPWASFTGGMPTAGVTPTDILSIYWNFAWMPPTAAYAVDIHIDNLAFIP